MIDWGDESAAAYTSWAEAHPERPVLGALMRSDAKLVRLLTPRPSSWPGKQRQKSRATETSEAAPRLAF
jgi:hypothetical protein